MAALRLRQLHERGQVDMADLLVAAVKVGSTREVFAYCAHLKELGVTGVGERVVLNLTGASGSELTLALHVLAQFPVSSTAHGLVQLLSHEDAVVREGADEALCALSGEDMGFDAEADAAERVEAVEAWTRWQKDRDDA